MYTRYAMKERHGIDEGVNAVPEEREYTVTLHVGLDLYTEGEARAEAEALARKVREALRKAGLYPAEIDLWAVEEN